MPGSAHRARRTWRQGGVAAAAFLAAAALAACGAAHPRAGATHPGPTHTRSAPSSTTASGAARGEHGLDVAPARPTTHSAITFAFTAPVASGVHGTHEISYSLSVSGPAGTGCVGVHEAGSPGVARGARAAITVGPAQLGRPWCPGRYAARAIELRSAHCTGSGPCPQYIAVVGVVAGAAFTVRRP